MLIALGSFDSRRPTAAIIAGRNLLARTMGLGAMRRYLKITRPSQLRSAAIAERRVEAYSRWQEAIVSFGGTQRACRITNAWSARVNDKVASPGVGARGAQAHR